MKSHPYAAEPWLRPLHDTMSCNRSSRLRATSCFGRWGGIGVRGGKGYGVGRDRGTGWEGVGRIGVRGGKG